MVKVVLVNLPQLKTSPQDDDVCKIIMKNAKTGKDGTFGDGRIFISPVEEAYTISTGTSRPVEGGSI